MASSDLLSVVVRLELTPEEYHACSLQDPEGDVPGLLEDKCLNYAKSLVGRVARPGNALSTPGARRPADVTDEELEALARRGYGRPRNPGKEIVFRDNKSHTCWACDYIYPDMPKDWRDRGVLADYPVLEDGQPTGAVLKRMICERHLRKWCP